MIEKSNFIIFYIFYAINSYLNVRVNIYKHISGNIKECFKIYEKYACVNINDFSNINIFVLCLCLPRKK